MTATTSFFDLHAEIAGDSPDMLQEIEKRVLWHFSLSSSQQQPSPRSRSIRSANILIKPNYIEVTYYGAVHLGTAVGSDKGLRCPSSVRRTD